VKIEKLAFNGWTIFLEQPLYDPHRRRDPAMANARFRLYANELKVQATDPPVPETAKQRYRANLAKEVAAMRERPGVETAMQVVVGLAENRGLLPQHIIHRFLSAPLARDAALLLCIELRLKVHSYSSAGNPVYCLVDPEDATQRVRGSRRGRPPSAAQQALINLQVGEKVVLGKLKPGEYIGPRALVRIKHPDRAFTWENDKLGRKIITRVK
jgi:hypothetical protein